MDKLTTAQVKAIGEHYVMARLTAMGFIVGLPPDNTKSVDLLVMSPDGEKNYQIQVKTRRESRSSDWTMKRVHEGIVNKALYYVFVSVPEKWTTENQPKTFIIPSKKVAEVLKKAHNDWLNTPGRRGQKRNDTDMRRIKFEYSDTPSISSNWLDIYRDN